MGSRVATKSPNAAGTVPMPRKLMERASTARVGMVVPTLSTCISDSAQRDMLGRESRIPSGIATAMASPPDMAVSHRCCTARNRTSGRYQRKSSITPLDWLQTPARKTATSRSASRAPRRLCIGIGLLLACGLGGGLGGALGGAETGAQVVGHGALGDLPADAPFVVDAGQPGGVLGEHQRGDLAQVVVEPDGGRHVLEVIAAVAAGGAGHGAGDQAHRLALVVHHQDGVLVAEVIDAGQRLLQGVAGGD